jgi:hypothetical protein
MSIIEYDGRYINLKRGSIHPDDAGKKWCRTCETFKDRTDFTRKKADCMECRAKKNMDKYYTDDDYRDYYRQKAIERNRKRRELKTIETERLSAIQKELP